MARHCGREDGEVLDVENEAGGSAWEQSNGASAGSPGVLFFKWDKTYR